MFYEDYIDQKKTIQKMKRYLEFFSKHMNSVSYQDYLNKQSSDMVKEDVMEYLNYSSSIIHVGQQTVKNRSLVDVIQQKDRANQRKIERELQIKWLCYGLQQLPLKQRTFLLEKYVYHLDTKTILERHGIVASTLNRNLRKGYLNLAIILKLEVIKENIS